MLASLAIVLRRFVRNEAPRTPAERWLVVAPLSLFAGYATAATFANPAAILKQAGIIAPGRRETAWSIGLLLAAGLLGAWATRATRGNTAYALAILWALGGIVVANTFERSQNRPVTATAALVAASLARARTTTAAAAPPGHTPDPAAHL